MRYIIYYRVSTKEQETDRQKHIIERFLKPGDVVLCPPYEEKISASKMKDRPELRKALTHVKHTGATLLVADLTRLTRNLHEFTGIVESGVPFVDASNPQANALTLNILATLAQEESTRISERVKAGMAAKRKQGKKQGGASAVWKERTAGKQEEMQKGLQKAITVSAKQRREALTQRKTDLKPLIAELRTEGHTTYRSLAAAMNERGYRTPRGCLYTAMSVQRIEK